MTRNDSRPSLWERFVNWETGDESVLDGEIEQSMDQAAPQEAGGELYAHAEKRADAQLRTLQVDEQVTGNALRGLGAAQAFQPRRTLGEGTMGKVQAHAAHPRAQQSAECIRVGAGGAERAVELAGHGVSSLG